MALVDTCVPDNLTVEQLRTIVSDAKNYALSHGLGLRVKENPNDDLLQLLPISLFPTPFPRNHFEFAKCIQTSVNKMMHKIAFDNSFLSDHLKQTVEVDSFTKSLLNVHTRVLKEGRSQEISLGLFRSDYMLNETPEALRQIEVNAISVSFGGLSQITSNLHRYIMSKYNPLPNFHDALPNVNTSSKLAKGLAGAWDAYGKSSAVILFVLEDVVLNISDQRYIEYSLFEMRPEIKVIRKNFRELPEITRLRDNQLLFVGNEEVAVVYFRTAYAPEQYDSRLWDLRVLIEKSKAIKCPSIHYQLAGVKKIQQILTRKEVLDKFIEPKEADAVYSTFAKIWGLEMNEEGDYALELGLNHPEAYVLKPQREGGGNNYYGNEIVQTLTSLRQSKQREAFILMELIKPRPIKNFTIRHSQEVTLTPDQVTSELGIFGVILGSENDFKLNYEAGYVLRTKSTSVQEGGISSGFGVIDTPYLY
ncbi:glutathione synthetase-like protein [Dinothrombium tinctorium]|uniref:Glutathione synthetase n=1 Tax=Dinothrombium tinctorium TaxID=1965070 RepID=A0A443QMU5_9ACAR|nr:glutathione synthetase-like protein [Dinothrombium tinctorium]